MENIISFSFFLLDFFKDVRCCPAMRKDVLRHKKMKQDVRKCSNILFPEHLRVYNNNKH